MVRSRVVSYAPFGWGTPMNSGASLSAAAPVRGPFHGLEGTGGIGRRGRARPAAVPGGRTETLKGGTARRRAAYDLGSSEWKPSWG
ncbi:MAG: hypothetical protein Kow0092_21010 [Deferrisomatales bacterium]